MRCPHGVGDGCILCDRERKATSGPPPVPARPECIHLGLAIDRRDAQGVRCGCPHKWLYRCDVHGECTTYAPRKGVACCQVCPSWTDQDVSSSLPTIAITQWNRPAALERLLASIREYLPNHPVDVEDTGGNLSAGRNRLYARVRTPYLVVMEEDFVVRPDTARGLREASAILDADPKVMGVGGIAHEPKRGAVRWGNDFHRRGNTLSIRSSSRPLRTASGITYRPCQLVLNWGVFRRDLFTRVQWDESLPIDEHWDYFWRASQAGNDFAFYAGLHIDHMRDRPNKVYNRHRRRNFANLLRLKHGFIFLRAK